ncbi:FMN-binding protein [Amnibacterium endophyticum]|uniref:FMN-binding protein n=1 Tax=Amnibacterium endophyticum TaxID=2109337 RepID=A0ABW4LBR4_9MICO
MRRAPIVITATVIGAAGVLLFKPLPSSAVLGAPAASPATEGAASAPSSGSGSASSAGSAGSTAAPSASPGSSAKDGTWTGDAVTARFGTTRVKAVISGGRITDVLVVQENRNDGRSVQISESAFPTLREEVLQHQTAAVDTVSGATWTSAQYEASLQSALDQAGYTAPDGSTASTDVSSLQERGGFSR